MGTIFKQLDLTLQPPSCRSPSFNSH